MRVLRVFLTVLLLGCFLGAQAVAKPQAEIERPPQAAHQEPMHIKFPAPQSSLDRRSDYAIALIKRAMAVTEPSYGPYVLSLAQSMSRERQFTELKRNVLITLTDSPANKEWDKVLRPVEFPTRRGLLNYRLFLIERPKQPLFNEVHSLEQLKSLRAGMNTHWLSSTIMRNAGFNLVLGNDYEGLFHMLAHNRFDYFPRSLHEIHAELRTHSKLIPGLMIENTLALHLPMPTFFYVNKGNDRLHQRLTDGLWQLHESGELHEIFNHYYDGNKIRRTLQNRRIFFVQNPYLTEHAIYDMPELWFHSALDKSLHLPALPQLIRAGH